MAEYIKFRLTAAKVSVSMAFLALLGGVAARAGLARSTDHRAQATTVHKDKWLPVLSTTGFSAALKHDLKLLEASLGSVYDKAVKEYKKFDLNFQKVDASLAKIDKAQLAFQKIESTFLKHGETATNSAALDGKPASAFLQGDGGVATGALSALKLTSARTTLLTVPGTNNEIIVVCQPAPAGVQPGIQVLVHNGTGQAIPAIQNTGGTSPTDTAVTLAPGADTLLTVITGNSPPVQLHLQTFPATGLNDVMTLTVSAELTATGVSVAGQVLNGVNGDG